MESAIDRLRKKYEESTSSFADRFKFENGENEIRILPRSKAAANGEDPDPIAFVRHSHYGIPQADGSKTAKSCPQDDGNYCALCDLSDDLKASDNASDKQLGKDIEQKTSFSMNILDLKNTEAGIQVLGTGPGVMGSIIKFVNKKYGLLVGLKDGRDITVTRIPKEKTGTPYPKYEVYPDPNVTDITDKLPKGWEAKLDELEKSLYAVPSSEETIDLVKSIAPGFAFPNKPEETSGKKESPPKEEAKPEKEEKKEEKKEESSGKDKCFGDEFSPKSEKCKECKDRQECKMKFLES